ncbi:MAG TPA: hypothetical protein VHW65_05665 [Gemmatimonadales bacterium]|jgi:hypothetical protein|nr:hypothetical protein [Gemmatimonadales bacterium]
MDIESRDTDPVLGRAVATLRDTPPGNDLWPGIASQMAPRVPRGTLLVRWPAALAAGLVVAVASAGGTAVWLHAHAVPAPVTTVAATGTPAVRASLIPADTALAHAIVDLETTVRANMASVDPAARASITKGLAALDGAIAEAQAERLATPDDPRAARYLTSTLRRKLDLLRTVSQLTRQSS